MYAVQFNNVKSRDEIVSILGIVNWVEAGDDDTMIECDLNETQIKIITNDRRVSYVSEL